MSGRPAERTAGAGATLSGLEWQVLGLLAQSLPPEEVADRLGLPTAAVAYERASALEKLGRSPRPEAAVLRNALGEERDRDPWA